MSKTAERQQSFMERRANFTTAIYANGRHGILPKRAIEVEIEMSSCRDRFESLQREIAKLKEQMREIGKSSPDYLECEKLLNRLRGDLGNLKKRIPQLRGLHFSIAFETAANMMLSPEALIMVRDAALQLCGRTKEGEFRVREGAR